MCTASGLQGALATYVSWALERGALAPGACLISALLFKVEQGGSHHARTQGVAVGTVILCLGLR